MSECCVCLVVYYEVGYVFVGVLMLDYDLVQKIFIIFCGNVGGLIFFIFSEEWMELGFYFWVYFQNQMVVVFGGWVVEEIVYGEDEVIIGVFNDFQQVVLMVCQMIICFGMSDELGFVVLGCVQGGMFFGCDIVVECDFFEEIVVMIDKEVFELVDVVYKCVIKVLVDN